MATLPRRLGAIWRLVDETIDEFSRARADLLAAALAFHALLSLAPLIILAVAIAGIVLGEASAHAEMTRLLEETLGAKSTETVNAWVKEASDSGAVASVVSVVLTLFGVFVIGLVDNFLRPILVGKDTKMPDYMVLVSTLGGLAVFGLNGFVIGPLIAALFMSCWALFVEGSPRVQLP